MTQPNWLKQLNFDPMPIMCSFADDAIRFYAINELLGDNRESYGRLWSHTLARLIAVKQKSDASWHYPGKSQKLRSAESYNQIETYRNLSYLIEMFDFNKSSYVISGAAHFMFKFQTPKGDIRGILGNQYTPYYTAAIAELLIKAGYKDDPRIHKVFKWLSSVRQDDGGWAIPLRTHGKKLDIIYMNSPVLEPVRSKPSSHMVTGVVLRAYAAHPAYRNTEEAQSAANILLERLFKSDKYPDRKSADFWLRFTYPFWFTDLISALDTLTLLGFTLQDPRLAPAVNWLLENQSKDGLWHLKTLENPEGFKTDLWISLAICRIIKRLYG